MWRELEVKLQLRELGQAPMQSQSAPKRFRTVDVEMGDRSGHTCGKCERDGTGACWPMVHAASAERRGMVHGIVGSQCQFGIPGFVISVGRLDI